MSWEYKRRSVNGIFLRINELPSDTIKDNSENLTKTMMLTSTENNKALENLNDKILEISNDWGAISCYVLSPLSKITNLENISQFSSVEDSNSNRIFDLLKHNTLPVTLYDNSLTFRATGKIFGLKRGLLKTITMNTFDVFIRWRIIVWICKGNVFRCKSPG